MSAWTLVPCLVSLRAEFDQVAPRRDEGADGTIGDANHTSSSDHTPDEDSTVLRSRDADRENEVHALDTDSTGPWPDGKGGEAGGWFDRKIRAIAARERVEYESATLVGRLQNIIWRGQIISRSWGWSEWRSYSGPSKHFDHAHFSARYLSGTESDIRPWGVAEEDDMPTADEIAAAVEKRIFGHKIVDRADSAKPQRQLTFETWVEYTDSRRNSILGAVAALAAKDVVDEHALADALAPALAAALPPDQPVTGEQLQAAIVGALRELAAGPAA